MMAVEDVVCSMFRWKDAVDDENVAGSELEDHSDWSSSRRMAHVRTLKRAAAHLLFVRFA